MFRRPAKTASLKVAIATAQSSLARCLPIMVEEEGNLEAGPPCTGVDVLRGNPDVLLLDLALPDAERILQRTRAQGGPPSLVLTSVGTAGEQASLRSLLAGAVDALPAPTPSTMETFGPVLRQKLRTVSRSRPTPSGIGNRAKPAPGETPAKDRPPAPGDFPKDAIFLLGASTGGTRALQEVLTRMPAQCPPIAVVQHFLPGFSNLFAGHLNTLCAPTIKEARGGEVLQPGTVYIAPTGAHLRLRRCPEGYITALDHGPLLHHQRPAVEALFESCVPMASERMHAAVLTGIGRDGADALLALKRAGAHTLAEAEETCVVYGMPKACAEIGAAERVLPLPRIAAALAEACTTVRAAKATMRSS